LEILSAARPVTVAARVLSIASLLGTFHQGVTMQESVPNYTIHSGQPTHSAFRSKCSKPKGDDLNQQSARILVADDDPGVRRFLRTFLGARGYRLFEASSGPEALQAVPVARPDVIILDLGLPELCGLDVTRSLRQWTDVPILILSVCDRESDKIAALDAGADDYLTKPFGPGELLARIRVALRRSSGRESESAFVLGELTVDLMKRSVQLAGQKLQLTPTEYDLLKALVRHSDKVLTHREVIRQVWGGACYEDEMHLLRVNVSNLRRKLEENPARPRYIVTEPGVGYRLRTE
jgi:two-component system KDP operon response regulator KdpE